MKAQCPEKGDVWRFFVPVDALECGLPGPQRRCTARFLEAGPALLWVSSL